MRSDVLREVAANQNDPCSDCNLECKPPLGDPVIRWLRKVELESQNGIVQRSTAVKMRTESECASKSSIAVHFERTN
jgi:hypothetical protein